MTEIGLNHFLIVGVILLGLGVVTIAIKRNAIGILMGVELILNAANLNLIAFNAYGPASEKLEGQAFALFVIVLAAAEAAVALAIFLNLYNNYATIDVDKASNLKG